MLKEIVLLSLVLSLVTGQCQANYQIEGLEKNSITFNNDGQIVSSTQTYNHLFYSFFTTTPAIAIAVQDFSFKYLAPHSYAIYPNYVSETGVTFQADYSSHIVSKIRINFLVSTHPDLRVGNFRINNLQIQNRTANVMTNIGKAFGANDSPVIRVFINGYDSPSNIVELSVSPINLQRTQLSVKISIGRTSIIRYLLLSYIAFSPKASSFISFGGQITNKRFEGSMHEDVSNVIYKSSYILYGLSSISLNGKKEVAFSSSITEDFIASVTSLNHIPQFVIIYVAIGKPVASICQFCYGSPIANGESCVKACPASSNAVSYKDEEIGCKTCPKELGFVYQDKKCTQNPTVLEVKKAVIIQSNKSSNVSAVPVLTAAAPVIPEVKCQKNAIFNGVDCVCDIGFVFISGQCRSLSNDRQQAAQTVQIVQTTQTVQAAKTTTTQPAKKVQQIIAPVAPVVVVNKASSVINCKAGQIRVNDRCVAKPATNCRANSYDNGLGVCVCNQGFINENGNCVLGSLCLQNSIKDKNGNCVCLEGFSNYSGVCSRCTPGAFWSQNTKTCINVCGPNSQYSATLKTCVCIEGFGLFSGNCVICPEGFHAANGYCVTCAIRSKYNKISKACQCESGYFLNEYGICSFKCGQNEVYSERLSRCVCVQGLGKVNNACQLCPQRSFPTQSGECSICKENQNLVSGVCRCKAGFAYNELRVCVVCSEIENGFLTNGICSRCPGNKIYDGTSACICPPGFQSKSSSKCTRQCQSNEDVDEKGNCFSCRLNEVFNNGKCVCKQGFVPNDCGLCTLTCGSNSFIYQGVCATCPLNTIFNSQLKNCVCPSDHYMNNFGVCEKLVLLAVTCTSGQFFDKDRGCLSCSANCNICATSLRCTTCSNGFVLNQLSLCITLQEQQRIQQQQQHQQQQQLQQQQQIQQPQPQPQPQAPQQPRVVALAQQDRISLNGNNIFLTLKTNPTFTFANPTEMQSFLRSSFATGRKPTVYCAQRNLDFSLFDCLLIYPSGVPNSKFSVTFSYDYQGRKGSAVIDIDPLEIAKSNSRSQG